jgi:hypothetical protein
MTRENKALLVVDFRTEFVEELLPMWRSSFEEAVGLTDQP